MPNPIPRINSGGISPKLKWANAKIKAETIMPEITPKFLERVGSKIPRNIISSNRGAIELLLKIIEKMINNYYYW